MLRVWQLQEAKNKFSEMVEEAINKGPQLITRRGVEAVVLVSYAEYRELVAPDKSLATFFRESPLVGVELDLDRDQSTARPEPIL